MSDPHRLTNLAYAYLVGVASEHGASLLTLDRRIARPRRREAGWARRHGGWPAGRAARGAADIVAARLPTRRGMRRRRLCQVSAALLWSGVVWMGEPAAAQERPPPVIEFPIGWAAFLDDAVIDHGVFGAGARVYLTRRVSVGPEIVYMVGPGTDRDLFLTGNVMLDLRPVDRPGSRYTPFLVAGAGFFQNRSRLRGGTFVASDPGLTAGAGVRFRVTDRLYLAPEARTGWEPHLRLTVTVGLSFGH